MTETEWLTDSNPQRMLQFLRQKASERKLRLFAVSCARLVLHLMPDGDMREAVEVAERRADGLASEKEQLEFVNKLTQLPVEHRRRTGENWFDTLSRESLSAYFLALQAVAHWLSLSKLPDRLSWRHGRETTGSQQPNLIRDIFGPLPF